MVLLSEGQAWRQECLLLRRTAQRRSRTSSTLTTRHIKLPSGSHNVTQKIADLFEKKDFAVFASYVNDYCCFPAWLPTNEQIFSQYLLRGSISTANSLSSIYLTRLYSVASIEWFLDDLLIIWKAHDVREDGFKGLTEVKFPLEVSACMHGFEGSSVHHS